MKGRTPIRGRVVLLGFKLVDVLHEFVIATRLPFMLFWLNWLGL